MSNFRSCVALATVGATFVGLSCFLMCVQRSQERVRIIGINDDRYMLLIGGVRFITNDSSRLRQVKISMILGTEYKTDTNRRASVDNWDHGVASVTIFDEPLKARSVRLLPVKSHVSQRTD